MSFHAASGICHGEVARWPFGSVIGLNNNGPPGLFRDEARRLRNDPSCQASKTGGR